MKIQFKQQPLPKFWLSMASEYPLFFQKAVKMLLSFATTYSYQTPFLALNDQIQKYHQELTIWAKQGKNIPLTKCHYSV